MSDRTDLVYLYDGSFDGMLCCIFESYQNREVPGEICPEFAFTQEVLWKVRDIRTDGSRADRVMKKLSDTLGKDGTNLIHAAFLYGSGGKETAILRFVRLGLKAGKKTLRMLGREEVAAVYDMEKAVLNEAHLLKGFIRFSDYGGALAAVIEPKHFVLPLLKRHFVDRYPAEHFLIFDKTHRMALVYRPYESRVIPIDEFIPPSPALPERQFRKLWQTYYDAIAIRPRENPRCRMTHMPKRFWGCMTEFEEKEQAAGAPKTVPRPERTESLRKFTLHAENNGNFSSKNCPDTEICIRTVQS